MTDHAQNKCGPDRYYGDPALAPRGYLLQLRRHLQRVHGLRATPDTYRAMLERHESLMAGGDSGPGLVFEARAAANWKFKHRWMYTPLLHRLADEIERLRAELDEAQLRSIEARNPGIDMDEVRRLRAAHSGRQRGADD